MTDSDNDEVSTDDPSVDTEVAAGDDPVTEVGDDLGLDEAGLAELLDQIGGASSAEDLLTSTIGDLERVTTERDEYLDLARRVQAEFENYKRRIEGQRIEQVQRAAEALVVEILPVLDACEAALAHGAEDVGPIQSALFNTLEKRGLGKVDDVDVAFDPSVHEAVLTEPSDDDDGPVVTEIMRTGYAWNGRVVRPAMVKVRG